MAETAVTKTKKSIWKYFGAMFMEKKDGDYAVSFTRLLALICFGMLLWKWSGLTGSVNPEIMEVLTDAEIDIPMALKVAGEVPETLMVTFWGLLGGKTAESIFAIWKGKKAS